MSFLSWLYGDTENAQRAAAADAELRRLNEERAKQLGPTWKGVVDSNYNDQVAFGVESQEKEIDDAFAEGWRDGQQNIAGTVRGFFKVIGDGLSSVLLGVPAWVWIIGALGLWLYLGAPGANALKKKFS